MGATAKVGTAYAEYRFDLAGFRQDKAEILKGLKEIQQSGKNLSPLKLPAPQTAPIKSYGDAAARAAEQALTLARAEASLKAASGDLPGAFERLSGALHNVDRSSISAIRAQTQLAQLANKMKGDVGGLSGVVGKVGPQLLGMAGAFGVVTSAAALAVVAFQKVQEGFSLVASIDANRRSLGAFLGDQARANAAFNEGAAFAEKYKIKQSEIATALSSLAPLLRTSTTDTEKQLEVLTRLQSLNPAATFKEAAFSVKELASGDYVSIADQFNLGKDAAQALRDQVADGVDVFVALDAELNRQGASVAVLDQRTQGAAGAQAAFAKASEDLLLALGTLVQGPGTAFLTFLADSAASVTKFVQDVSGATSANLAAGIVQAGQSYGEYTQAVQAANAAQQALVAQTDPLGALFGVYPQVQQLSAAEHAYAQALLARGVAADAASTQTAGQAAALGSIQASLDMTNGALSGYEERLFATAAASDSGLQAVQSLTVAFATGVIGPEQFGATLTALESTLITNESAARANEEATLAKADADAAAAAEAEAATVAQEAYADAVSISTEAVVENLGQTLESELATQRLAEAQGFLASLGGQVASGLLTAAQAAAQLAARYGIASAEAARLIQLQATLARTKAVADAGFAGVSEGYLGAAIGGRASQTGAGPIETRTAGVGSTLLSQLATEGEAAAKRYEAAVSQYEAAERKAARGGGGGGGKGKGKAKGRGKGRGGAGGKSEEERAAEKAAKDAEREAKRAQEERQRQLERLEDLQRDHEQKILDIQAAYARKQQEQERRNHLTKLQSRADFYDALTSAQSQGDISAEQAQKLSASYEQAFAESQRLAQEGKAKLAADYLELRQRQIQEELAYEQQVAAAKEKGDKAEVARLEQIEAMRRAAREEELKQLLEEGDTNQKERDESLAAENDRYVEQQAEILGVTKEVAAARVEGETQAADATRVGNLLLHERLDLLQQIANASVGRDLPREPAPAGDTAASSASTPPATAAAEAGTPPAEELPKSLKGGPTGAGLPVSDAGALAALTEVKTVLARLSEQVAALTAPLQDTARNTADTAAAVQTLGNAPLR